MQVEHSVDLSKKTSFGIGCVIPTVCYPRTATEVVWCKRLYPDAPVIGSGTKVLINDRAVILTVIDMSQFSQKISIKNDKVTVHSGMKTHQLVEYLASINYSGLEFLYGIPGLVGGAVAMNAGAVGRSISECIESVKVIDGKGKLKILHKDLFEDELKFDRRYSILQDTKDIVVSTTFKLFKDIRATIEEKIDFYRIRRKDLPKGKSAGGIFINHHVLRNYKLDGLKCGDAYLEGNFIVNKGNATAQDVLTLIKVIKSSVKEELQLEVRLIGF